MWGIRVSIHHANCRRASAWVWAAIPIEVAPDTRFAILRSPAGRDCLSAPWQPLRALLRPPYCRAGCKRSRPGGFLETPPRDLGGVCVCGPRFCKDLRMRPMRGRVSAAAPGAEARERKACRLARSWRRPGVRGADRPYPSRGAA